MDSSVTLPSVTPRKSRLARTFAKVLQVRAAAGVSPEDDIKRAKVKKDRVKIGKCEDEGLIKEAFVEKIFASLSSIKALYAQLQHAQTPYDVDVIQTADQMIVAELKNLSELKQCYLKKMIHEPSPEMSMLQSEVKEQRSILRLSHFIAFLRQAVRSIQSFVRLLIDEMEAQGWDLIAAASSIYPGVTFWKTNHVCFAFESFVCSEMFDGFDQFDSNESSPEKEDRRRLFFNKFIELKSINPADYLAWKPKSTFAEFCRAKYLQVIHPKMEESFFGSLQQRNLVSSGELPETPFFAAFAEMAKRVWLLRCLAFSLDAAVTVFRVSEGSRFSEVYMESLSDEAFDASPEMEPRVGFTVVPGFRIGKIVVQARVYLSLYNRPDFRPLEVC